MVKDIENKFFEAFDSNGVVDKCFKWIEETLDLYVGIPFNYYRIGKRTWTPERMKNYRAQQQEIKDQAVKFYDNFFMSDFGLESPLFLEIAHNLDESKDDSDAINRYIEYLLRPFKQYSNKMHPTMVIERLQYEKEQCNKDLQTLEQVSNPTIIKSTIEELQYQIDRTNYLAEKFQRIYEIPWERDMVEYYWGCYITNVSFYAQSLDVLLLKHGINLLYYQKECEICLVEERNIFAIANYFGSVETALEQIKNAKPKLPNNKNVLPDVLNNDTAKTYFDKAIEYKLMDENYTWLKTKALLAQFCCEMSAKLNLTKAKTSDGRQYVSWKPFEALFNVSDLRGAYNDFQKKGNFPKNIDIIRKIFEL